MNVNHLRTCEKSHKCVDSKRLALRIVADKTQPKQMRMVAIEGHVDLNSMCSFLLDLKGSERTKDNCSTVARNVPIRVKATASKVDATEVAVHNRLDGKFRLYNI